MTTTALQTLKTRHADLLASARDHAAAGDPAKARLVLNRAGDLERQIAEAEAASGSTYDPDGDSDFDLAMRAWIIEGAEGLVAYSTDALDELRSCATCKLTVPIYRDDARLIGFEAVLDVAMDARRMGESESF